MNNPIETEQHYQDALALMTELWDEVADNPNSPYGSLLSILSDRIAAYETSQHPLPEAAPAQVLAYLMAEQGLTQQQVADATGIYQSNLSQILAGKRTLTTVQVKRLAEVFNVSPLVLL